MKNKTKRREYMRAYMKQYSQLNKAKRSSINKSYHASKVLFLFEKGKVEFPLSHTFKINTLLFVFSRLPKDNVNKEPLRLVIDAWIESGL